MGACGSSHDRYSPAEDNHKHADKPPRKTMTPEELRSSRARDSMRFNNRKKKAPTALEEGDEGSPVRHKVTRDSMVFNNRSHANKALALTLVPAEDFICGCRDVLRSPVLLDKIRELVEGKTCGPTCHFFCAPAVYGLVCWFVYPVTHTHTPRCLRWLVFAAAVCTHHSFLPYQAAPRRTVALTCSACR